MLDEQLLDFQITIFLLLGTVLFLIVYYKVRDLRYYVAGYFSAPLGYIIYYLHYYEYSFRLIGNIIFAIGPTLLTICAYIEYKSVKHLQKKEMYRYLMFFNPTILFLFGIQTIFLIASVVGIVLIVKIYLIKKTPRHIAIVLFLISIILSVIASLLNNFNIVGAWEFSFFSAIIFATLFFVFPIITYIEELMLKFSKSLVESEELYRNLFQQSPYSISLFDREGTLLERNEKMIQILIKRNIIQKSDYKGKTLVEIIQHFQNYEFLMKILTEILNDMRKGSMQDTPIEIPLITKDCKTLWLYLQSSQVCIHDKDYFHVIIQDITEMKEAERIILEKNKRLMEINEIRQELMTRISHELKTPLTSIYGVSQFLFNKYKNKEYLDDEISPFLDILYRGTIRLKKLIENLLDSSRLDQRKVKLNLNKENISTIISDCIKELSHIASSRQLDLESEIPDDIFAEINKSRFSQVIINILSNAIKNTPHEGKISVRHFENDEYIDISIKDTGVGITEKEKKKLFQKFGKIERYGMNLDVDIDGIGLGLYISKEIVELHGGSLISVTLETSQAPIDWLKKIAA